MNFTSTPLLYNLKKYAFSSDSVCAFFYNPCDAPLHKHCDFYEFSLITYGSFVNEYNGKQKECPRNTLIFYREGEEHCLWVKQPDSIHFTFIIKKVYFESMFKKFFPDSDIDVLDGSFQLQLTDRQGEFLSELASQLMTYSIHGTDNAFVQLFLFNALSLCIIAENEIVLPSKSSGQYVDSLLTRLNNFTYIKHTVKQIYTDYPIAQSSLITQFKERTSKTIIQYHNMKKMEYAAQLLSTYTYSVTDVCLILQYNSLSHFEKTFKAQFGVSPREYQRLQLGSKIPKESTDEM